MEFATSLGVKIALSALSPIINKLGTYFGGDVTPEEMEHLKLFILSEISVVIEEGKSGDLVQLMPLLEKLQETALQVDDLLDLYEYNQIKNQVSSSSTNLIKKFIPILKGELTCILPKSSLRVNLEKLLNFVDQVEKKYPFIKSVKTKDQTQQKCKSPEATTSTLSSAYFGRDKQYESIVNLLLDESHADSDRTINEVPVIAIKGLGGSGKSLTAQVVCKDNRITNYFDALMWVHVTTDFDVERLTKNMVESAENKVCPQPTNLGVLQTLLKESVKKRKRFLLVLDDVWCEDKIIWDKLVGPLNEAGGKGSKIIITTRLANVARLHAGKENVIALDELEAEDCWSILKYYAFNNSKHVIEDQGLVNVGTQIIREARSSPLALKVAGSSLRDTTSVYEWEKILKRDVSKGTMDLLSFSFQHLPLHLQRCFTYCSLFPKGYIHKEQLLVSLWIAQGYIEKTNDRLTLEEEGSIYIADLLSYSFFEKKNYSDEFVIHDLLHDLAERASSRLCHRIEHSGSLMNIPPKCIHLSMNRTVEFKSIEISNISKLRNLRSLIILDDASCTNIFRDNTDTFQILSKLRALYVQSDHNMEVLSNLHIDQLKHLRYLHVQSNKKLPKSLTKLYHLQFLNLRVDSNLIEYSDCDRCLKPNTLPQGFGNLINLRTLKFHCIDGIEVDYLKRNSEVISVEKLKSLQNVTAFHHEKDNVNGMVALKNIPLCGSLRICDLENVKSKGDAEKAMLKQKKNLNELTLQWGSTAGGRDDTETCEEVLEGLEPHQNLKSVTIRGYQGVKVAKWMVRKSWPLSLRSLTLSHCKSIREISFLPPGLLKLHVECCDELKQLPPFGSTLLYLIVKCCDKLKQLPPFGSTPLYALVVDCCDELKQLPHFGSTLKVLQLVDCPVLRLQSMPNNSASLDWLKVSGCPMLMTDEPLLVGDTAKYFSKVKSFITDEPLLVLVLVQQQAFSSIKFLHFEKEAKPFPPLLEEHFHEFSSLGSLWFRHFKNLPNLEKLSSLEELSVYECPDVELLPNLPVSLKRIDIEDSPKLAVKYEEDGPLHKTISHIPVVSISESVNN